MILCLLCVVVWLVCSHRNVIIKLYCSCHVLWLLNCVVVVEAYYSAPSYVCCTSGGVLDFWLCLTVAGVFCCSSRGVLLHWGCFTVVAV